MRIITTAVLAGISLLLAGVIHWVKASPGGNGNGAGNVLTRFDPGKIDKIVVKRPGGEVSMEKRDGSWFFSSPIGDRVDQNAAAVLLDQLNHLAILDEIDRSEIGGENEISAGKMGLDSGSLVRVELYGPEEDAGNGESALASVLLIGAEAPITNSIYARLPESRERPEVYVVDGNPRKYLLDPLDSMRDRRLVGSRPDRLTTVVVHTARGDIEITRRVTPPAHDWHIMKPLQTPANKEVIEAFVTSLASIQVVEVLEDGGEHKVPNPIPDDSLGFTLTFFGEEETPVRLFLQPHYPEGGTGAAEQGVLEAFVSDRPARFLVKTDLLDKVPQEPDEFRDLHLPKLPRTLLESITIQSRTQSEIRLRSIPTQSGLMWEVLINEEWLPANQTAVNRLVEAVNGTRIIEFVSDSAARLPEFGLEPPALRVMFRVRPPQGMELQPGQEEKLVQILQLGRRADDEFRVFANIIGQPYIYEVPPELPQAIPSHFANWKSLKLLNFNAFHLKEIRRVRPGEPAVTLAYDVKTDSWEASRDGVDVSRQVDRKSAKRLLEVLGSLTAAGWQVNLTGPYQRLQQPSAIFQIKISEFDPAIGEDTVVEHTLKLAPSNSDLFFYGQLNDSPDVFRIDQKTYTELIRPLLGTEIAPPN